MHRIPLLLAAFAVAALALILPVCAGEKSDAKVKATAKASKLGADGKQTVTITIDIEKDWYIYANPVKSEDFEDNKTRVTIKAKDKVDANVLYPTGKTKEYGKIKMNIYEKSVVIEALVKRSPGDTSPLQISIDVNSCSQKGICLQPGTVKLTVP
jgi:DsbC/DsbD-like thiol-disulfide interchange protein